MTQTQNHAIDPRRIALIGFGEVGQRFGKARSHPEVAWVPSHWDQSPAGWTWVDGYWQ